MTCQILRVGGFTHQTRSYQHYFFNKTDEQTVTNDYVSSYFYACRTSFTTIVN